MRDIEEHFSGTKSGISENSLEMCEIRNDKATVLLTGLINVLRVLSVRKLWRVKQLLGSEKNQKIFLSLKNFLMWENFYKLKISYV